MELAELTEGQAALSELNRDLLDFVAANPEAFEEASFGLLRERHPWIEYPLQPWPIFVSSEKARGVRRASVVLANLVQELPSRLFGNDPDQMVEHLGLDPTDARFLTSMLEDPNLHRGLISRSDFVFGADGFRCLEVNLSKPGGLGNSAQSELYLEVPLWSRFLEETGSEVRHEDNVEAFLRFLFDEARDLADDGRLSFAVVIQDPPPEGYPAHHALVHWTRFLRERSEFFDLRWRRLLRSVAPELEGSATLCLVSELEERNECVYLGGKRLHAVVEYIQGATPRTLFIPWMAGNLRLLNGPLSSLFSDKRLFAWLSELADSDLFSAEERQVIHDYVPWTRRLLPRVRTRFDGRRRRVSEIAEQERERMVLKAAHGSSGAKVYLGREAEAGEWSELVQKALDNGKWIVQEHIEPVPLALFEGAAGWAPHRVIWGVFAFGGRPGGSFLRSQVTSSSGVVSTELGANEGLFFEVDRA